VIHHHDIRFYRPYERVLDVSRGKPWARWCVGGTTNLAMNCLQRQLDLGRGDAPAIIWEGEDGEARRWTYAELADETSKLAAGLRSAGMEIEELTGVAYNPLTERWSLNARDIDVNYIAIAVKRA